MGKVITLRKANVKTKPQRRIRQEDAEQLRKLGGDAINSLTHWRRSIPSDDRMRMAKNMDAILREYRIKPGNLQWEGYNYQDRESFNRDLSRMRMPETAAPGRRLVAYNTKWLNLLQMIVAGASDRGDHLTLEALAERLTRGTRFHPTQKIHSREEKLLYTIKLWANEVDEKLGLLKTYKRLASARADYFSVFKKDYGTETLSDLNFSTTLERPATYFKNIPDEEVYLFNKPLGSYTTEDWDALFGAIPEDMVGDFKSKRTYIEDWGKNFDPKTALFDTDTDYIAPSLNVWTDYAYMPRWFIGYLDTDALQLLSAYPDDDRPGGGNTLDPLSCGSPDSEMNGYIVLYPNTELSRIIPYVFNNEEDFSTFKPLTEMDLASNWHSYFTPMELGMDPVSKNLMARIEESFQEIRQNWMDTASSLEEHPYLVWSRGRDEQIDKELERLTNSGTKKNT